MRILYFRLKGYAGIFQGMGIDELSIPFHKLKNQFIIIRGANGSGKSTILKSLSPDIDGSDYYRTDYMINNGERNIINYHAEKEIHFQHNNDIYKILIVSPVKQDGSRATTKAYISKNDVELNPNGNVSSFKDIRDNVFNMDSEYIKLSLVSSENRGIVDMIPSERKKFMSSIIETVEFYNDCYKNLSKKSSKYKNLINTIKSKIYNIGDEISLQNQYKQLSAQIKGMDKSRDTIKNNISENTAKVKLYDKDGKIQELYQSIVSELEQIKHNHNECISKLNKILNHHKLDDNYKEEYNSLNNRITELTNIISSDNFKLQELVKSRESIQTQYDQNYIQYQSLKSEQFENNIEEEYNKYSEELKDINIYLQNIPDDVIKTFPSKNELLNLEVVLYKIESNINYIKDVYSIEDIKKAILGNNIELSKSISKILEDNKNRLGELSIQINQVKSDIDEIKVLESRPSTCKDNSCIFIKRAYEISKTNPRERLEGLLEEQKSIESNISNQEVELSRNSTILDIEKELHNGIKVNIDSNEIIINKLPSIKNICDNIFNIFIDTNISFTQYIKEYIKLSEYIEDLHEVTRILKSLESNIKLYKTNVTLLENFNISLNDLKFKIDNYDKDINNIASNINANSKVLNELNNKKSILEEVITIQSNIDELNNKKSILAEKYTEVRDQITTVKKAIDDINLDNSRLSLLEKDIIPLKDQLDAIKFNISNLYEYRKEMNSYNEVYEKIEFLRNACSPTRNSIQALFISIYMDKIIMSCNQLLSYLFNGNIQMMRPEITDRDFNLPFITQSGKPVSDVSMGSTSQKCMMAMVFSFATLHQGSDIYNIMRLDEIEGGLDSDNRRMIVPLLKQIADIMQVEQCIMISHNIEIDTFSSDIINITPHGVQITEG